MYSSRICNSKFKSIFILMIPETTHGISKFHNSNPCAKIDFTEAKQQKILKKLLAAPKKKRSNLTASDVIPGAKIDFSENSKRVHRRKFVLEALFMDHISGLIANEEIDEKLNKYPLEITNVKVSSNYNNVNVWWSSSDFKSLKEISNILEENSRKIRSILTTRNLMGRIPHISFVIDKQSNELTKLEIALSKADFGPDHQHDPTAYLDAFKSSITAQSLESLVNQNFEALKDTQYEKSDAWKRDMNIPADMKHNIFGLDHSQLLAEVIHRKHRRSNATQKRDSRANTTSTTASMNYDDLTNNRALEFQEFIKQRKLERKKESKKTIIDKELKSVVIEEMYEKQNEIWDSNCEENELEDYYDESE